MPSKIKGMFVTKVVALFLTIGLLGPSSGFSMRQESTAEAPTPVRFELGRDLAALGVPSKLRSELRFNAANDVAGLLNQLSGVLNVTPDRVEVLDAHRLQHETVNYLVREAALSKNADVKIAAQRILREAGLALGIKEASIHDFYMARQEGKWSNLTVPAYNVRVSTFETMKEIFRAMLADNVGAFILELAKSEKRYTGQTLAEYVAMAYAAAIATGYRGLIFLQGDHYQVDASLYFGDPAKGKAADPAKAIKDVEKLIEEAIAAGKRNIDIDPSTLVDDKVLEQILLRERRFTTRFLKTRQTFDFVFDFNIGALKENPEDESGAIWSIRRKLVDDLEVGLDIPEYRKTLHGQEIDYLQSFGLSAEDKSGTADLDKEMHKTSFEVTMHFIRFIRNLEKQLGLNTPISIGVEERHIDNKKHAKYPSTVLGSITIMKQVIEQTKKEGLVPPSKLALQTGAMHGLGGNVDWGIFERHQLARKEIGVSVFVQHGTSTLNPGDFQNMPRVGSGEAHLATEYQKISLGTIAKLDEGLRNEMAAYLEALIYPDRPLTPEIETKLKEAGLLDVEKRTKDYEAKFQAKWEAALAQPGKTRDQILVEILGDALEGKYKGSLKDLVKELSGPFKEEIWDVPLAVQNEVSATLWKEFRRINAAQNVRNTTALVNQLLPFDKQNVVLPPRPTALQTALAGRSEVRTLKDFSPRTALDRFRISNTDLAPRQELSLLHTFLQELQKEQSKPDTGKFVRVVVISDQHGTIDKFDNLVMDAIRSVLPKGKIPNDFQLNPDKELQEQLSYYGVNLYDLRDKLYFHNLGDLMDRGPYGVKVFRRSLELINAGLSDFIIGNHDLWEAINLWGIHLPWYEGFNFYGYTDAYDAANANLKVEALVTAHHRTQPEIRTKTWWAKKLAEFNAFHDQQQKTRWHSLETRVNGDFDATGKKRIPGSGIYAQIAPILETPEFQEHKKLWDKFRGRNVSDIEIYTGVRAVGFVSLNWWKDLLREFNAIKARPGFKEEPEALRNAWQQAIDMMEKEIIPDISKQLEDHLNRRTSQNSEGEWWWRIFEAINYQNYTSLEWWAKDWVSHKDWGTAVITELNEGVADSASKVDQANYLENHVLQRIAEFFRDYFTLYHRDVYQNVYMHAFLPVDQKTGEFFFTYKHQEYRGQGNSSFPSVWEGLDRIASDIRNRDNSPRELYEALSLVNSWYADNTTIAKSSHIAQAIRKVGANRLAEANGFNRLFTGHIPFYEFHKLGAEKLGPIQGFQTAGRFFFTDHGMGDRFGSRGASVRIDQNGILLRGYESSHSKEIVSNPRTIAPNGNTEEILFENPGIPREIFLPQLISNVQVRITQLENQGARSELRTINAPYVNRSIIPENALAIVESAERKLQQLVGRSIALHFSGLTFAQPGNAEKNILKLLQEKDTLSKLAEEIEAESIPIQGILFFYEFDDEQIFSDVQMPSGNWLKIAFNTLAGIDGSSHLLIVNSGGSVDSVRRGLTSFSNRSELRNIVTEPPLVLRSGIAHRTDFGPAFANYTVEKPVAVQAIIAEIVKAEGEITITGATIGKQPYPAEKAFNSPEILQPGTNLTVSFSPRSEVRTVEDAMRAHVTSVHTFQVYAQNSAPRQHANDLSLHLGTLEGFQLAPETFNAGTFRQATTALAELAKHGLASNKDEMTRVVNVLTHFTRDKKYPERIKTLARVALEQIQQTRSELRLADVPIVVPEIPVDLRKVKSSIRRDILKRFTPSISEALLVDQDFIEKGGLALIGTVLTGSVVVLTDDARVIAQVEAFKAKYPRREITIGKTLAVADALLSKSTRGRNVRKRAITTVDTDPLVQAALIRQYGEPQVTRFMVSQMTEMAQQAGNAVAFAMQKLAAYFETGKAA